MSASTLSSRLKRPVILDYGIACATPALAFALDLMFNRLWGIDPSASLFLCGIMLVAWISGPGPALVATALTVPAFDYFLMQPVYSFALEFRELSRLVPFTIAALFVVSLSSTQRRATDSLRRARDEQQETVEELRKLNETLRTENAERARAEENTRRAEQELRLLVDNIPVLAARYRADGLMDFRNKVWRDYTGLSQDNVEGHRWGSALHPDDQAMVEREWRAHIATGEAFEIEQRLRRADGEYRWYWVRRVPLRDDSGNVIRWYGVGFDIEDRRLAEESRRRSDAALSKATQELQLTVDTIPALVVRHRADGVIDFVNQTWRNYTGLSHAGWKVHGSVAIHPDDVSRAEEVWFSALKTGDPCETELRIRRADGEYRWHFVRRVPLRDDHGDLIAWYGVSHDIEDQKRAENALRASQEDLAETRHELQLIIDTIPVLVLRHRADGIIDFVNQVGRTYSGMTTTKWTTRTSIITHPDDVPRLEAAWDVALATGGSFESEVRLRGADGEYRWFMTRRVPLHRNGEVAAWYAATYDIEDRKHAEDALRASEAELAQTQRQLQLTIDSIPVMVSTFDADGTRSFVNRTWQTYTGHDQDQATGKGLNTSAYYHPDDLETFEEAWRTAQARGEIMSVDVRTRRADGVYRWYTMRRAPQCDERGNVIKWYSVGIDVEDQKIAEHALKRSEAQLAKAERELRLTLDSIPSLAWRTRADGFAEYINKRWLDYTGFSLEQSLGWEWQAALHPDDRAGLLEAWREMLASGKPEDVEARMRRVDGAYRWFLFRAEPLRDESGAVTGWYGTNTDIEDRKQAEGALHTAQSALAHASRVATLGEISATIAHEVNQPLGAIVANGQACLRFLHRETPDLNDVRGAIEWIVKDGNRAGEVIRRVRGLLKKADTYKLPLDVNDVINEVVALLHSEFSAKRVTLRLDLASAIPKVVADRVQLQQVIINLVMNGIDAMQTVKDRPHALLIRSCIGETGQVVVAVSDSGVGISDEITGHVFDAFFSTKPGGLGMGLSICRSIIEDHGGRLWPTENRKEPGATFQFALPGHQDLTP
jgi:PAS domain S-box-containing protein